MLCALSLKPGTASPFEIAGPPFPVTRTEGLQAFLPKTGAHWEQVFQSLSPNEQAALGPFLLDVAIIQSNRKGEFTQMVRLLETAVLNGIADTTLCAQSAELLSRMASFGGWTS